MTVRSTVRAGFARVVLSQILGFCLLQASLPALADDATDAQGIVDKARITLAEMTSDRNYRYLNSQLNSARGVLIFPQVLKAGFFLGGSGGTGVLLVRDAASGAWAQPVFYTMGAVSFGLQIGGEAAQVVMVVNSQRGVDSLLASSVKLGADASIAIGPVGAGAQGSVTPTLDADFVSFAKAKGAYAGLNLEGSVLGVRDQLNQAYYGKPLSPVDLIIKKAGSNEGSASLRGLLQKLGTGKGT